jgi:cytidylate kinase
VAGNYINIDGANLRIRSSNYTSGYFGAGFTLEPNLLEVNNIVARGMIRTAVFQKAHLKVFMVADIRERALRRLQEMKIQSMFPLPKLEDLMVTMKQRDEYDSSREIDPLRQADDAILLDTSNLTIEDQAQKIIELANSIHNN